MALFPLAMFLIFDTLQGPIAAALLFALLWLASVIGARLRDRLKLSNDSVYATTATVSLLVLLIGFTFSLALNRYDGRRALVVEEASAIHAIWKRLPLEPQPQRDALAVLVQHYADQRLAYFAFGIDLDDQMRADEAADAMMDDMWALIQSTAVTTQQPAIARMMMDSLGRADDVAWRREEVARAHIPTLVVNLLVVFSLLTAASIGFSGPSGHRLHLTHLIFFAMTASAIMLVLDLDQPRTGLVRVSQRPIIELQAMMQQDVKTGAVTRSPSSGPESPQPAQSQ